MTEKLTPIALQPKEKPLRTKRGHRKPSFLNNLDAPSLVMQGPGVAATLSPSGSDAFSHTHPDSVAPVAHGSNANRQHAISGNGYSPGTQSDAKPQPNPKSAFEMYCRDMRHVLTDWNRKAFNEGIWDPDQALAQGWQNMGEGERADIQRSFESLKSVGRVEEDVEMGDPGDDTEGAEEGGGFTAVNRA